MVAVPKMLRLVLMLCLSIRGASPAAEPTPRDVDLRIEATDLSGKVVRPFGGKDSNATVLFFLAHDCPVSNRLAPEMGRIARDFAPKGVRCIVVYPDPDALPEDLRLHGAEFGLGALRAFHDRTHTLVHATGAATAPEAVVVTAAGHVVYRGRINNLYEALDKPRTTVTRHDLRQALQAVLANRAHDRPWPAAVGCPIVPLPNP